MQRIRKTDTKPERIVRRLVHAMGYRYRLHQSNLPGSPDIVLTRHRTVIFVHGCFWHGHRRCKRATLPATRQEFWFNKISSNKKRDEAARRKLCSAGWR